VALDIADHGAVIDFCRSNAVDFVVVGPDAPIAAGIVDDLDAAGFKAFGPTKAAGKLESSKSFTKALCHANNIPTAASEHFTDADQAKAHIRARGAPIVVKADGLAAGKGVVVAMTKEAALAAVDMMFGGALGEAGAEVVVEEFMEGGKPHSSPCATASTRWRFRPRRITSAPSMATRVRTPAAWAPIRRRRSSMRP
jgi:phosphoribosylamine--glycine ligase